MFSLQSAEELRSVQEELLIGGMRESEQDRQGGLQRLPFFLRELFEQLLERMIRDALELPAAMVVGTSGCP